ncbi:uncharacterized protein LOC118257426 isoform X4 [Cygnus atratus]|uniref:uncharacterized protein LOC118257426 isoform X4 n=1 Tax=Cygnus atratus TaxID=8868 RepID=UPI0021B744B6|nr:uncharacterized protein LOC118257426 isoform X4 [Cygnus atratus]
MCGRGGCGPLLEQKAPGRLSKERSGDAGGDARGAAAQQSLRSGGVSTVPTAEQPFGHVNICPLELRANISSTNLSTPSAFLLAKSTSQLRIPWSKTLSQCPKICAPLGPHVCAEKPL